MTFTAWFEQTAEQVVRYALRPSIFLGIFSFLVVVGVGAIGYGAWGVLFIANTEIVAAESNATVVRPPPDLEEVLVPTSTVDVSGGVVQPGVYVLSADSRVVDAVAAAGGFSDAADKAGLSMTVNLAQRVSDGDKVHIPLIGEENSTISALASAEEPTQTSVSIVGVNTASQKELEALPGVGEKRAQDIIAGRPYSSLDQLLERQILPASLFEKLQGYLKL